MPCRPPISGWPVWGSRRACAAVCRRISAAVPLWFLEGASVGMVPFHCRRQAAVGRARVCRGVRRVVLCGAQGSWGAVGAAGVGAATLVGW